jgi:hypothetical protein
MPTLRPGPAADGPTARVTFEYVASGTGWLLVGTLHPACGRAEASCRASRGTSRRRPGWRRVVRNGPGMAARRVVG